MSRQLSISSMCIAALLAAPSGFAADTTQAPPQMTPEQKAEMEAYTKAGTPGEQHKQLAATAGNYTVTARSWQDPKAPPVEDKGTATRTMALDGRVLVEQFSGTMMGAPFIGHGMTGYDNVSGKYWATWNDTMSTGITVSTGTCDAKGTCQFEGSWNDAITKRPTKMRMTTRWVDGNTEMFEMYAPDGQGHEMKMMEMTYKRM